MPTARARSIPFLTSRAGLVVALAAGPSFTALAAERTGPPNVRPGDGPVTAERLVRVGAVADAGAIVPGRTVRLAVTFDITPGWHIYWENPGESGAATEITVRAPAGFTVGPVEFPRPRSFDEDDFTTFGYAREAVLFVPVTAGPDVAAGPAVFEIDVFYLVCRERCLIGRASRRVAIPVVATEGSSALPAPDLSPAVRARLDRFRRRVPAPLSALPGAVARRAGDRLVVTGPAGAFGTAGLLPLAVPGITWGPATSRVSDGTFRVEVPLELRPQNADHGQWSIRGVLALGQRDDDPSYHFTVALPPPASPPIP